MRAEWQVRREIVEVGQRLYTRGLIAASDGNISSRLWGDEIIITPSGSFLGELKPGELISVNMGAPHIAGSSRPSSELPMHALSYAARPGIGAIVHAHPPMATALSLAGYSMEQPVLPEVLLSLGSIITVPYFAPGSEAIAESVADAVREHDALLLERHGALTVGATALDAFRKMEKLEHAAQQLFAAHRLGGPQPLSPTEIADLTSR